jgi:4-diphosphocytidyl-2-C-methyl-D-erythritol kinase
MEAFAPAKVNLYLHVGPLGPDGYHPICSLMMFADIGDTLTIVPGEATGLSINGDFAPALNSGGDNMVTRARDALLAAAKRPNSGFGLSLRKTLPVASGLGGGSSDAAAALRLLAAGLDLSVPASIVLDIARSLGSDVPACLSAHSVIATGRGDRLVNAKGIPDLDVVLVNPGVPSPTAAVYGAYDRSISIQGANAPQWPERMRDPGEVARFLKGARNDLQAPAVNLQPAIGEVLAALSGSPETLFARMSGSGATCFALCADEATARSLASRLTNREPKWWVRACRLGQVALGSGSPA